MSRTDRIALAAVVAAGLVLRIAWSAYAARPPVGLHDQTFYRLFAEQLAGGRGYRFPGGEATAYYPVGYPAALAAAFWVLRHTPLPSSTGGTAGTVTVAAINVAAQCLSIVLVAAVTRRLTPSRWVPVIAAGLVALWPNLVLHTAVALTESLFIALLLAALWLAVGHGWTADRRLAARRLVLLGVVAGAATLVRPVSLPLFPALLVMWLAAGLGWRRSLARTGVVVAAALVVLVPWALRNAVAVGSFTLSTNTGDNLCMSRRVGGTGGFELDNPRCDSSFLAARPRPAYEVARDAFGRRQGLAFVRAHPAEEVKLLWRRGARTFANDADAVRAVESYGDDPFLGARWRRLLSDIANAYAAAVTVLALPGLVLLARRDPGRVLVLLTLAGLLVPPFVFFGDPRFHVPAAPLAAISAALAVGWLASRGAGRAHGYARTPPVPTDDPAC